MSLSLDQLDLLATPADLIAGAPLQLPIDAIDEDPDQPRQEFDPEGLAELAETIKERGVRQPISVRRHPDKPDRWMLNFGARRLRASKLVGKLDIPAFVDNTADSYDQVIENEQREGLKPLEFSLFVQRRLAAGDSRADIARRLGKSAALITYACALIDAPDWLLAAYREGRCRGLRELYELRQAHDRDGDAVQQWADAQPTISRDSLSLRRAVAETAGLSTSPSPPSSRAATPSKKPTSHDVAHPSASSAPKLTVEAEHHGVCVVVSMIELPLDEACVLVVEPGGGREWRSVPMAELQRLRLIRADASAASA